MPFGSQKGRPALKSEGDEMYSNDFEASVMLTAWMATTASQMFFMQLGFLCYEVGHVSPVWASSIVIKNIEDTFVGIIAFVFLGFSFAECDKSHMGLIGGFDHVFLLNAPPKWHEEIFIMGAFATTTATIISGAVLERMKNKAYLCWCFLIVLFVWSVLAHWVWNPMGWLLELGFMDGAGSSVIHMTGGMASFVAVYFLGPRSESVDSRTGKLKPPPAASRPVIVAIGYFILWYGWFAFNISSPVSMHLDVGGKLGSVGLNTVLCPISSSVSCFLITRYYYKADPSFEHLISCCLAGCVSIAAGCYTMPIWAAYIVGFMCPPVYFSMNHYIREKLQIDDPLSIVPIHFGCGMLGVFCEGLFADESGFWDKGLVYGGYKHFGVQCLGIVAIGTYIVVMCLFLWKTALENVLFRGKDMRVSALDTYLGTKLFKHNTPLAFRELIGVKSSKSRQLLLAFHQFCAEHFCDEQLDFIVAVNVFHHLCDELMGEEPITANVSPPPSPRKASPRRMVEKQLSPMAALMHGKDQREDGDSKSLLSAHTEVANGSNASISQVFGTAISEQQRVVFESIRAIVNAYVRESSERSVNVGEMTRATIIRRFDRSIKRKKILLDRNMFASARREVSRMLADLCARFLSTCDRSKTARFGGKVRIPYLIDKHWCLHWDTELRRTSAAVPRPKRGPDIIISENERVGSVMRERMQKKAEARVHKTHSEDKDERLADLYESLQSPATDKTKAAEATGAQMMGQILELAEMSPNLTESTDTLELAKAQSNSVDTDTTTWRSEDESLSSTARYLEADTKL